ncbi:MAG TPA: porin [Gammaproteobacteria bacterium]
MKKRFLAIAIAAGLASPFAAQAEANVYGQLNLSVGMIEDTSNNGTVTNDDNWQVNSHNSRLGVKGSEDLGNGLSANYQLEWGVNPDSNSANPTSGANNGLTQRNQWVGLKGNFGEVRVGKHDTPLKMSQGKFDQFGDLPGDIVGYGSVSLSSGDIRMSNVIAYLGKAGDIKYAIALVPGENDGVNGGDGPADSISAAVIYEAGPLYAAFAMDQYDDTAATAGDTEDLMRITVTYAMGTMDFGFMYEAEGTNGGVGEYDGIGLSFAMGMGKNTAKFQYLMGDIDGGDEATSMSVGYDFGLSKATTLGVMYTDLSNENAAGVTGDEVTFFGVNMLHKF